MVCLVRGRTVNSVHWNIPMLILDYFVTLVLRILYVLHWVAQGYSICMYMGGGGVVERSPIKKSWEEGVKMKKLGVYMKKNHGGVWNCERSTPPPRPPCTFKWNSPHRDQIIKVTTDTFQHFKSVNISKNIICQVQFSLNRSWFLG